MFIRGSSKLACVLGATAITAGVYAGLNLGLAFVAVRAERSGESYPWKDEDHLRYLVPGLFEDRGAERLFIIGPSEARESLLHEELQDTLGGMNVFQGALSLGTFEDMLIVLEYLERSYGADALPCVLLVGLTARFVANIPRDESPLVDALNRYSPSFTVTAQATSPADRLQHKSMLEGIIGRANFLLKQQKRYKAGLTVIALRLFNVSGYTEPETADAITQDETKPPWHKPDSHWQRLERALRDYHSPYKYTYLRPRDPESMRRLMASPKSFWYKTHAWEPARDAALIVAEFAELRRIADRHGIKLVFVNLPEHPMNQAGYRAGAYEEYLSLVRDAIGDAPFLDLRHLLREDQFFDIGHPTLPGAHVVTRATADFLDAQGVAPDVCGARTASDTVE